LSDWISNLRQAEKGIQALDDFRKAVDRPSTSNTGNEASVQLNLFRDLQALWNQKTGTKFLFNIQLAAIHLSSMLSGQGNVVGKLVNLFFLPVHESIHSY
jgi:hypothetical protein